MRYPGEFTEQEAEEAVRLLDSLIARCEKMLPQFAEGTSQQTLLVNRLSALRVGRVLIDRLDEVPESREALEATRKPLLREELESARIPLVSILSKCEKAIVKHTPGNATYSNLERQIHAMRLALENIEEKIAELG